MNIKNGALAALGLLAGTPAFADYGPWGGDLSPRPFLEIRPGYAHLDKTNRDLLALEFAAGCFIPTNDVVAHDIRFEAGFAAHASGTTYYDVNNERYKRGTELYPLLLGYTFHVAPLRHLEIHAGPRVGFTFAGITETTRKHDSNGHYDDEGNWVEDFFDSHGDYKGLFTYGGEIGIRYAIDRHFTFGIGYSYRRLDGASFTLNNYSEKWSAQGEHLVTLGLTARF